MNAAFLLVTTAWIAGADAAAPAAPVAAPVYSTSTGGCAGGGCASGGCASCGGCDSCGGESEGFLSKLKARFHHGSDCGCGGESEGLLSKLKGRLHKSDCGCDTGCGGCDVCESHGSKLHGRLGGLFHKSESCGCDSGCGGCAGGGCAGVISAAPGAMTMPRAEPIGAPKEEPKKLPSGDGKGEKKPGSVQLIPQPVGAPMLELAPASGKSPF